jgi:hypothetical protein
MFFWFLEYDVDDIITTSLLGLVVVVISIVIFHCMWLKRQEFFIPTTYHNNKYKFSLNSGFYTKMKTLIFDLSNHNYWVTNVGNIIYLFSLLNINSNLFKLF